MKEKLEKAVKEAEAALVAAEAALDEFNSRCENNIFATLEEALGTLEESLREKAFDDCQGAYNCGNEFYTQQFIAGGVNYLGILEVEYNRHDKMYYYIDRAKFTHIEIV